MIYDLAWNPIDQIGCGKEGLIPKLQGHRGLSEQGEADLNNVTVFALS